MKKDAFPTIRHNELLSNGESETLRSSVSLNLLHTLVFSLSLNIHPSLFFLLLLLSPWRLLCWPAASQWLQLQPLKYQCCNYFSERGKIRNILYYLHQKSDFILFKTSVFVKLWLLFYHNFCRMSHYPTLNLNNPHLLTVLSLYSCMQMMILCLGERNSSRCLG